MNDDQLISEYLRRKPTIFNSRSLVSQIADENGLSVPSVRAALQKAKVYIAKPLDIGAVSERDRMAIEERLSHFSVPAGQRKLDAQAKFHEEIARETGYSRWAIDECGRFNKQRTNAEWERYARGAQTSSNVDIQRTSSFSESGSSFSKGFGIFLALAIGVIAFIVVTSDSNAPSTNYDASTVSPRAGTATAAEREEYSVDKAQTPTGMNSETRDRYERLSPEGKEAFDRQMEAYDAVCARSSEC